MFKIVNTFQDPLTRQLAEAVRIDLRGEDILNSKAEYSRCRVPRLRVDMEGWLEKKKVVAEVRVIEQAESLVTVTTEQAKDDDANIKEAEESLAEIEINRKAESAIPEGRKPKKRKLEKLEGWGVRTTLLEEHEVLQKESDHVQKWD